MQLRDTRLLFLLLGFIGYSQGVPNFAYRSLALSLPTPDWHCTTEGYSCKDCSTLQWCNADNQEEYTVNCRDQNILTPVCSPEQKKCVQDKEECSDILTNYDCDEISKVPDPTDCTRYILCSAPGQKGISMQCPKTSTFDSIKSNCVTKGVTCYTSNAECAGKNKIIPYKPNPSYYVVCQGSNRPLLKYCGSPNKQFRPHDMECVFTCKNVGFFPDPPHKHHYYVCVTTGENALRRKCPDDTEFDSTVSQCVKSPGEDNPAAPED